MDFEQAKGIPLAYIFDKLGYKPLQHKNYEILYQSPFSEREGDWLRLYPQLNVWFDDHLNKRGNSITFIITYLRFMGHRHTPNDALRWIEFMTESYPVIQPIAVEENIHQEPGVTVKKIEDITNRGIINYLKENGIPHKLASRHLKQVRLYVPKRKKSVVALGLKNEDQGWEIFNPNHRVFIGTRNIYYIRGIIGKPDGLNIFANLFDYYAAVIQKGKKYKFDDASLILNSYSLLSKATPYITPYGFKYVCSWMPNNQHGELAQQSLNNFFVQYPAIEHRTMNNIYANHVDVNTWHRVKMRL